MKGVGLPRHANEFAFRWNTRHDADGQRLETFARWIEGKRLTYRQVSHLYAIVKYTSPALMGYRHRDFEIPNQIDFRLRLEHFSG